MFLAGSAREDRPSSWAAAAAGATGCAAACRRAPPRHRALAMGVQLARAARAAACDGGALTRAVSLSSPSKFGLCCAADSAQARPTSPRALRRPTPAVVFSVVGVWTRRGVRSVRREKRRDSGGGKERPLLLSPRPPRALPCICQAAPAAGPQRAAVLGACKHRFPAGQRPACGARAEHRLCRPNLNRCAQELLARHFRHAQVRHLRTLASLRSASSASTSKRLLEHLKLSPLHHYK